MSLKDKLSDLSQTLEKEKKTKEKSEEDKRLEPVRANIKSLELTRGDLDLIKGSLDFKVLNKSEENDKKIKPKSGEIDVLTLKNKEAFGMQDYSEQTDKKIKTRSGELDALVSENKEALSELGVSDKEQLAAHPEFAAEEEVVNYKKSLAQGEELKMSDAKLKERLTKLGVEFDEKNFSYESASQAVEKKIVDIDKELTQEKLKTPEGREEVINNLAEEFEKSAGKLELHSFTGAPDKSMDRGYDKNQPDSSYGFTMDRNDFRISFKDEKAKVADWSSLKLIPDNFKDIEATYGEEVAREALEKTYQNKIHNSFVQWDERGDKAISLKEQIKVASPEERQAAKNKLDEFTKKQNECLSALQEKSKELKKKGIDFDPDYASEYGSKYEELTGLTEGGTRQYISESLNKNDFPPQYDFVKLQEAIDKRIEQVNKFIEVIRNIKDKKDTENFLENEDSDIYIGKIHKAKLDVDFREDVILDFTRTNIANAWSKLANAFKTYGQAEEYLNGIIEKNSEGENKVSEAIINTVKAHLKSRELEIEIKQAGIGNQIYNLEDKIKAISNGKEYATKIMGEIEALQSKLSGDPKIAEENLILEGNYLIIPSIRKEYDDLRADKPLKQKDWENKKREREKHEATKPGLFGKEKWQTRLNELKKEEEAARNETKTLEEKDQNALYHKAYHFIEADQYTSIGKMIEAHRAQGKASEIFNGLKAELMKVIDTTLPPKILQDYAEYKASVEKIG